MKLSVPQSFGFVLPFLLLVALVMGCSKEVPPPEPIPLDQVAGALEKAFATAKTEPKELSAQIVTALNAKDYGKAGAALQKLSVLAGLNKEQSSVAARAIMTVNQALQEAQSKGDQKAVQTLKSYQINK